MLGEIDNITSPGKRRLVLGTRLFLQAVETRTRVEDSAHRPQRRRAAAVIGVIGVAPTRKAHREGHMARRAAPAIPAIAPWAPAEDSTAPPESSQARSS